MMNTITDQALYRQMLRCPRCRGELTFEKKPDQEDRESFGEFRCKVCPAGYNTRHGIYFFFLEGSSDHQEKRDQNQQWDKAVFEAGYQRIGHYRSGEDFDRRLGYPSEVSRFLYERVKKRLLDWIPPQKLNTILDVGCGTGYFLLQCREKIGNHASFPLSVGIDISETELGFMSEYLRENGIQPCMVVHGNSEFLPFADGCFDLVTCSEVIEHVRNPGSALSEIHRILKPGGLLLLSTPSITAQNGWNLLFRPFRYLRWFSPGYQPKEKSKAFDVPWKDTELINALRNAGFGIEQFEYNAVIPHPWYFKFLPTFFVKPTVLLFTVLDRHFKFMLKRLALHFVVKARKSSVPEKGGTRS